MSGQDISWLFSHNKPKSDVKKENICWLKIKIFFKKRSSYHIIYQKPRHRSGIKRDFDGNAGKWRKPDFEHIDLTLLRPQRQGLLGKKEEFLTFVPQDATPFFCYSEIYWSWSWNSGKYWKIRIQLWFWDRKKSSSLRVTSNS